METDKEIEPRLITARAVHLFCVFVVMSVILIMAFLIQSNFTPIWDNWDFEIILMAMVLGIITVINMVIAFFLLPLAKIMNFTMNGEITVFIVHILRISLFVSVGIYGLILFIISGNWQISLPFYTVSALTLALTFPTRKRWVVWLMKV